MLSCPGVIVVVVVVVAVVVADAVRMILRYWGCHLDLTRLKKHSYVVNTSSGMPTRHDEVEVEEEEEEEVYAEYELYLR